MWVMSKTVLMVLLLGLLVVLTSILHVYQEDIIERSARGVIMLWSESANSVVMFRSGSAIWPLDQRVVIQGGGRRNSVVRDYTGVVTNVTDVGGGQRLIFMLAWGDHVVVRADDIDEYATAVSLTLPNNPPDDITDVYFFKGRLDSSNNQIHPEYINPISGDLILNPSVGELHSHTALLFYRDGPLLCVASKKLGETNSSKSMHWLSECCNETIPDGTQRKDSDGNFMFEPDGITPIMLPCCKTVCP